MTLCVHSNHVFLNESNWVVVLQNVTKTDTEMWLKISCFADYAHRHEHCESDTEVTGIMFN